MPSNPPKKMTSEQIRIRNAKPEYQAKLKAWRKANRARINLCAKMKRYGLTIPQYEQMLKAQDTKCKVCLEPFTSTKSTHVDHNHVTGKVRAILCGGCNTALGHLRESDFILQRMLAYLRWAGSTSTLAYDEFVDLRSRPSISEQPF